MKQADYDLGTAQAMSDAGRHFYAVFMCHLCIEKALKGVFQSRWAKPPPRTHNLVGLLRRAELAPPEEMGRFIARLNEASVATRYPENLNLLQREYTKEATAEVLAQTTETLKWIKTECGTS